MQITNRETSKQVKRRDTTHPHRELSELVIKLSGIVNLKRTTGIFRAEAIPTSETQKRKKHKQTNRQTEKKNRKFFTQVT